ncbi:MAG: hypothetical protein HYT16_01055 [DPANN group archaeon]|nr:hypothetical protein [DPANN group archaeon]
MALKLDSKQATTAFATFVGVVYTAWSAWIALAPQSFASLMQLLHPFMNVGNVLVVDAITPVGYLVGLVGHIIFAWIFAYVFVYIWNNASGWFKMVGGGRKRRRR